MPACADQKPSIDVRSVLVMPLRPAGRGDPCPALAELRSLNLKSGGLKSLYHGSKACLLVSRTASDQSFALLDDYLSGKSICCFVLKINVLKLPDS